MTSELDRLCKSEGVRATVEYGSSVAYDSQSDWQQRSNPWTVRLRYNGRSLTVPFWTGQAITDDPTAADVLSCLISDAMAGNESFEDFCGNMGYDEDSRSAEKSWRQCQQIGRKVRRFLADSFDQFAYAEH